MSKSKNRGNSQRDSSKVKLNPHDISQINVANQSTIQNMTVVNQENNNESLLVRDMQNNQSTSILQDMSVLSRLGDSKNQIIVVPNFQGIQKQGQSNKMLNKSSQ